MTDLTTQIFGQPNQGRRGDRKRRRNQPKKPHQPLLSNLAMTGQAVWDGMNINQDTLTQRGQQFTHGVADSFAGIPAATAIPEFNAYQRAKDIPHQSRDLLLQRLESVQTQIQTTRVPEDITRLKNEEKQLLQGLDQLNALEASGHFEHGVDTLADTKGFQAAQTIRDIATNTVGTPAPDDSFGGKLAHGAGNIAGSLVTAIPTMGAGPAVSGFGANAESLYREALQYGADEETAQTAAQIGGFIGVSEAIPFMRALNRAGGKTLTRQITQRLNHIAQTSGAESATEAANQVMNNATALGLYDETRDLSQGVTEAALLGGVLGAGLGTVTSGRAVRPQAPATPQTSAPQAPRTPNIPEAGGNAIPNTLDSSPRPRAEAPAAPQAPEVGNTPQNTPDAPSAPEIAQNTAPNQPQAPQVPADPSAWPDFRDFDDDIAPVAPRGSDPVQRMAEVQTSRLPQPKDADRSPIEVQATQPVELALERGIIERAEAQPDPVRAVTQPKTATELNKFTPQGFSVSRPSKRDPSLIEVTDYSGRLVFRTNAKEITPAVTKEVMRAIDNDRLTNGRPILAENVRDAIPTLAADLESRLQELGLGNVSLAFDPTLDARKEAQTRETESGDLEIVLGAASDPLAAINHEAVHVMQKMGAFTPDQWERLATIADQKWVKKYNIAKRYPDLTKAQQREEAIAEAYAEYAQLGQRSNSKGDAAFAQMAEIMAAAQNTLLQNGIEGKADLYQDGVDAQPQTVPMDRRTANVKTYADEDRTWLGQSASNWADNMRALYSGSVDDQGNYIESARERFQDYFLGFREQGLQAQRDMQIAGPLPAELDAYSAHTRAESAAGAFAEDVDRQFRAPIADLIVKNRVSPTMVDRFLVARHEAERIELIRRKNLERGMDPETAARLAANAAGFVRERPRFEAEFAALKPAQREALEQIGVLFDQMNDRIIDYRVEQGLISPNAARAWRNTFKHYAPLVGKSSEESGEFIENESGVELMGNLDSLDSGRPVSFNASLGSRGPEVQSAFGRTGLPTDTLAHAFAQVDAAISRGSVNGVARTIYNLHQAAGDNQHMRQFFAAPKPPANADPDHPSFDPVALQEFQQHYNAELEKVYALGLPGFDDPNGPNVVNVKVDGRTERVVLSSKLGNAFKNFDSKANMGKIMGFLSAGQRLRSAMLTRNNPMFAVVSLLRDSGHILAVNSLDPEMGLWGGTKALARAWGDIPKHMRMEKMLKADPRTLSEANQKLVAEFREFLAMGGKTSYIGDGSDVRKKFSLTRELDQTMFGKFRRGGVAALNASRKPGEIIDDTFRFAMYQTAKENGMTPEQAAIAAKEAMTNFNRKGSNSGLLGAFFMFGNASLQSTQMLIGKMKKSPKRALAVTGTLSIGTYAMTEAAISAMGDEYFEIPEYERDQFWIMPTGKDADGNTTYAKWYKPYGFRALANMGAWAAEARHKGIDPAKMATRAFGEAIGQFSPVPFQVDDPSKSGILLATPDALDPVVEVALNYSNFTGNQIDFTYRNEDEARANLSGKGHINPILSPVAEFINKATGGTDTEAGWINLTGREIAHIVHGFGGGVSRGVDRFSRVAQGKRDADFEDLPLTRLMLGQLDQEDAYHYARNLEFETAKHSRVIQNMISQYVLDEKPDDKRQAIIEYMKAHRVHMVLAGINKAQLNAWVKRDEERVAKGNYRPRTVTYRTELPSKGPINLRVRKRYAEFADQMQELRGKAEAALRNAKTDAERTKIKTKLRTLEVQYRNEMNADLEEFVRQAYAKAQREGLILPAN